MAGVGVIVGLIGAGVGLAGTYLGIRRARTAEERRFLVGLSLITWVVLICLIAAGLIAPARYAMLLFALGGVLLAAAVGYANQRLGRLR